MPVARNCARRIGSETPVSSGRWSAAPAEARRDLGAKGFAVPLCPEGTAAAAVAPNAAAVRMMVPTLPGSCTPARTTIRGAALDGDGREMSSKVKVRGVTRAATPWGCSVSAMPSKRRSVVCRMGMATSGRPRYWARRARWRSPDSLKRTARIGEAERRASSTRRGPSTPTAAGFGWQAAAEGDAEFLEPAIVAAGDYAGLPCRVAGVGARGHDGLVGLSVANGCEKKQRKDLTQRGEREEHGVRGELCGRKRVERNCSGVRGPKR